MFNVFRLFSLRYFLSHRLRSAMNLLSVGLGVALIFSIYTVNQSIVSSFQDLVEQIAGKATIEISAPSPSGLDESMLVDIVQTPGVQTAVPMVRAYTVLSKGQRSVGALLLGVPPNVSEILPGSLSQDPSSESGQTLRGVLMPLSLAESMQLVPGDAVDILMPTGPETFSVVDTLTSASLTRINQGNIVILPLVVAQNALGKPGKVDSFYIISDNGFSIDQVLANLRQKLGDRASVTRPAFRGKSVQDMLSTLQGMLFIVGIVTIFASMFLVHNTMSTATLERRRDLGILYSLGVMRRSLFGLLLLEGGAIGAAGSVLGVVLGLALAQPVVAVATKAIGTVYGYPGVGVHLSVGGLFVGVIVGAGACLAASYFPARHALSLAPVETMEETWTVDQPISAVRSALGAVFLLIAVITGLCYLLILPHLYLLGTALFTALLGASLIVPHVLPALVQLSSRGLSSLDHVLVRLASDSLLKAPARTWIAVSTLMVCLAMLVGVGTVAGSFRTAVNKLTNSLHGADVYVFSGTWRLSGSDVPLDMSLGDKLTRIPGVRLVSPVRFMLADWRDQQIIVVALKPGEQRQFMHPLVEQGNEQQAWDALSQGDAVMISSSMANRYGFRVGDDIELKTPGGPHRFRVAAVITQYSLGSGVVLLSWQDLQRYWQDSLVDRFDIKLQAGVSPLAVKEEIMRCCSSGGRLYALTGIENHAKANQVATSVLSLFSGLEAIALLVTALGVFDTLFVAVLTRRREIGILRAIGATRRQILGLVLYESVIIGLVGSVLGITVGLCLSPFMVWSVQPATGFRIGYVFPLLPMVKALVAALLAVLVAAYYPASRAARAEIIEAIAYE